MRITPHFNTTHYFQSLRINSYHATNSMSYCFLSRHILNSCDDTLYFLSHVFNLYHTTLTRHYFLSHHKASVTSHYNTTAYHVTLLSDHSLSHHYRARLRARIIPRHTYSALLLITLVFTAYQKGHQVRNCFRKAALKIFPLMNDNVPNVVHLGLKPRVPRLQLKHSYQTSINF